MGDLGYEKLIALGGGTASVLQGTSQYTTGLFSGFIIDWTFIHWPVPEDNIPLRIVKLLSQAAVNGLMLNYLLPWIHPSEAGTYRDPTGGYLLAFGLIHGQPRFASDAKLLTSSILELYEEQILKIKPTSEIVSESSDIDADV